MANIAPQPEQPALKFKGIPFTYSAEKNAFLFASSELQYVLKTHYPKLWEEAVKRQPELGIAQQQLPEEQKINEQSLDSEWKPHPIDEASKEKEDQPADTHPTEFTMTEEEEKPSHKEPEKIGMISRISKGIKKIIAKITPKKYHKRLHLSDD